MDRQGNINGVMTNQFRQFPYRSLGLKLRSLREKEQKSIPDVSGAVEIEPELLSEIEEGAKLPSEDILLLLISHFGLKNDDAMKLWRLAGYDLLNEKNKTTGLESLSHQSAVFLLPIDSRIVYTDKAQVSVNELGIVVNFQQSSPQQDDQPLTVAKVGMSRESAEVVINTLKEALASKPAKRSRPINLDKKIKHSTHKNKQQKDKKSWPGSPDS